VRQNHPFRVISLTEQVLGSLCGFLTTFPVPVEVPQCAQALYESQAIFAKSVETRDWMKQAGAEEKRHLDWTGARIAELGGRVSYLNPIWYAGSFALGAAAALMGDKTSLSFVLETERQVEAHLAGHLEKLPATDFISRQIVEKMRADEQKHADLALQDGAEPLASPVQLAMKLSARVMTGTAYYI
jgi:3-demethoxyubiquinol 3-hydroxylase